MNTLKPSKHNLKTYLPAGIFLITLSVLDVILNSFFKLKNKFSPSEIIHKTKSLKGVLEPFSDFGNMSLLKRSGFKDVVPIFQWLCFKGYLCIK